MHVVQEFLDLVWGYFEVLQFSDQDSSSNSNCNSDEKKIDLPSRGSKCLHVWVACSAFFIGWP